MSLPVVDRAPKHKSFDLGCAKGFLGPDAVCHFFSSSIVFHRRDRTEFWKAGR